MNDLRNLQIDEISILTKKTKPAVAGALVRLAKSDTGSDLEPVAKAISDFETIVDGIMVDEKCLKHVAMAKAATKNPDALEAYEQAYVDAHIAKRRTTTAPVSDAQRKVNDAVTAIQLRDGCNRATAMETLAKENPLLVASLDNAA